MKDISAFPVPYVISEVLKEHGIFIKYDTGMTLRDYFAIHCQGIDPEASPKYLTLSFPELGEVPIFSNDPVGNSKWWIKADVLYILRFADTMMKARSERTDNARIE